MSGFRRDATPLSLYPADLASLGFGHSGDDGFEKTYQQCMAYSQGLLVDMGFDVSE